MQIPRAALLACFLLSRISPAALAQSSPLQPPANTQPAPSPVPPKPAESKGLGSWLCEILGIDPRVYERMTRVRGRQSRPTGNRLMKLNLVSRVEETLWDCTRCWSPTQLEDGRVAVIRNDGLWLPPQAGEPARHVIVAEKLHEIVGPIAGMAGKLLLIRQNDVPTEECSYSFWRGDMISGNLEPLPDAPCMLDAELPLVLRPGRLRGDQLLVTSEGPPPFRLLISSLDKPSGRRKSLAPWLDKQSPLVDRSDAIWWSDTEVLYIASAPRRLGQSV